MKKIDTLIVHADLFTMRGEGVGYVEDGCVAVDRGRIIEVGTTAELAGEYDPIELIHAENKMVLPGFIDAHIHTSMSMLRGVAQDTKDWMLKGVQPIRYYLKQDYCPEASYINVLEALASGTTTFGEYAPIDHLNLMEVFLDKLGVRSNLAAVVYGWNTLKKSYGVDELFELDDNYTRDVLRKNIDLFYKWKKPDSRTNVMLGVHAPDTVSKEMLLVCHEAAVKHDMRIHMHVAQGDRETVQMLKRYGKRSIPFLDEIGYLDSRLMAVHLTDATEEETRLVASRGASMVLCSGSIGICDGIMPPAAVFQDAGGKVALGSDQSAGNNCNQMINEMKLTAMYNKIKYGDPSVMPAWKTLRMATIEGAQAIGLDKSIGSIEKGKCADIIFIDLVTPTMMPVIKKPFRNHVPNLVYSARGSEICRVMVNGRTLYRDGVFTTVDYKYLLNEFKEKSEQFFEETPWDFDILKESTGWLMQQKEQL